MHRWWCLTPFWISCEKQFERGFSIVHWGVPTRRCSDCWFSGAAWYKSARLRCSIVGWSESGLSSDLIPSKDLHSLSRNVMLQQLPLHSKFSGLDLPQYLHIEQQRGGWQALLPSTRCADCQLRLPSWSVAGGWRGLGQISVCVFISINWSISTLAFFFDSVPILFIPRHSI